MSMIASLKRKWLKALRSGEYEQCEGQLHIKNGGYCCLGVLAETAGCLWTSATVLNTQVLIPVPPAKYETSMVAPDIEAGTSLRAGFAGISAYELSELTSMNDGYNDYHGNKRDFAQIADWIEENL